MDPKQISNLAKLFRDSGDQILNSDSKLTLSGPLLRALNDSFSLIADKHENYGPKTFQVVKPYNSKSDVFRDLQLIHDFVQKTHILSLIRFHDETINGIDYTDTADLIVDIGKFHNLKTLEIHRIPIGQIRGIQQLRSQLQELIGIRCIDQLKTIMTACGNDQTSGFIWTELKSIDFSFNGLRTIDNSLEFAPWLQCLNLSHNQINHIGLALKFLPHLTVVNLSFNQLRVIPKFHSDAAVKHLRILQLANNFIEDITGISRLDALVELDLSNNCLLDHSHLLPVITLISLQYLNLMGNPLFYHPRHREATARYLHKSTATVKFQLDQSQLTKSEKLLTGQYSSYQAILITSDHSSSIDNNSIYDGHQTPNRTSSFGSVNTLKDDLDLLRGQQQQQQQPVQQQRKSKPRRAIILEKSNSDMEVTKTNAVTNEIIINSMDDNEQKIDLIDKKPPLDDHLDTKRKIEDLRKHYGDEWLHSQGSAEMVKSVIGIISDDKKRIPLNINTNNLFESNEVIDTDLNTTIKILSSTPIDNYSNNKSLSNVNLSQLTNYQSIDDLQEESEISAYKSIIDQDNGDEYEHLNESTTTTTVYPTTIADNIDMDIDSNLQQISDTEDNEYKYIVYRVLNKSSSSSSAAASTAAAATAAAATAAAAAAPDTAIDTSAATVEIELFLIVSDLSIKEKDCLNGKTITKWQLKSILSCERRRSNILHIQFDTIRKDKKERLYRMETATGCFKLEQYLRDLLARRPLSEMNQTTYRCANCTTHFSRENIYKKQNMDVRCPQCKSSYVIEIKESTINYSRSIEKSLGIFPSEMINDDDEAIDAASATEIVDESVKLSSKQMEQSTISHNSIDSVSSLIDEKSSSCSKLSNGIDDSLNSNQSVAGSSTNCEDRDADFPIEMSAGEQLQNYDSDVDILSNPSQSSIEILLLMDGSSSINSSRKHSEERRLVQSSGIETTATTTTLLLDGINTNNDNDNNSTTNNSGKNKTNTNTELRNLTESSSSGSITDSICTSYEKQSTVITTTMATTTPSTPSTLSTSTNLNLSLNSNVTKSSSSDAVKSSSSSSMLGGLFQSTNLLMSRTPKKTTTETVTTSNNNNNNNIKNTSMISMDEQFKFNYTKFDVIDHRLKLYFYQHLFKDNNEHFKCLVKCVFISEQLQQQQHHQQQIDQKSSIINGLLVISSTKLYLLQCNDNCFTDDIGKWLKKQLIISIDRIKSIKILPWKIGITLQIESIGNYHIILYDIIRTENFFLCLRSIFGDNIDVYSTLDFSIDDIDERILMDVNDKILYKLIILNSCKIEKNMAPPPIDSQMTTTTTGKPLNDDQEEEEDDNKEKLKYIETLQYPILIVTDANLYLTLDYKWILTRTRNEKNINESSSNISSNNNNNIIVKPILKYVQSMSNLFEIDRMDQNNQQSETKTNNNNNNNSDQSFTINFMDEGTDQMECWHCHFETDFCKITTYHAISQSWEVVFGIPFGNN